MLCKYFAHVGMGDTGEGMIRYGVNAKLQRPGKISMIDGRAHMGLVQLRESWVKAGYDLEDFPPSFSIVRNPFEWRISFWIHELRMRRFEGTFYDFCCNHVAGYLGWYGVTEPGVKMIDYFRSGGGEEIDHVGQFEFMKRDLTEIMLRLMPEELLSAEDMETWFPEIYNGWTSRPWVEAIEQWMKSELYTPDLIDRVYKEDAYFFDRFGYTFEDRFRPGGSPPCSGAAGTVWGHWTVAEVSLPDQFGHHLRSHYL